MFFYDVKNERNEMRRRRRKRKRKKFLWTHPCTSIHSWKTINEYQNKRKNKL